MDKQKSFHLFVMRHADARAESPDTALFGADRLSQEGCVVAKSAGVFLTNWLQRVYLEGPSDFGRVRVLYGNCGAARETAAFLFKQMALAFGGKSGIVQDGPHEALRLLERYVRNVSYVLPNAQGGLFDPMDLSVRHLVVVTDGLTQERLTAAWKNADFEPWSAGEQPPGGAWVRYLTDDKNQDGPADHGYVFGPGAPLWNPRATRNQLEQGLAF